jgi:hypothetical protein
MYYGLESRKHLPKNNIRFWIKEIYLNAEGVRADLTKGESISYYL